MQIPLVRGRVFSAADDRDSQPVVVVDEYLVRRYFSDSDPIGRQIQRGGPESPPLTIVGVVGTINGIDLGQPVERERIYYPIMQAPFAVMGIVIKTTIDPQALVSDVRSALRAVDAEQPMADVRTMDQWVTRSLQTRQAPTVLLMLFGAVALALSGVGVHAVLAFGVALRTREFGIRQALGADRSSILGLVLRQGVRTAGIGILAGLAGALVLTRYLESQLFEVAALDLTVFTVVIVVLLAVALLACYLPARTSTRIDPVEALRET